MNPLVREYRKRNGVMLAVGSIPQYLNAKELEAMKSTKILDDLMISNRKCYFVKNGNYYMVFFDDGTKIRFGTENTLDPEYPECIDMCISKRCHQGCDFCYMNCTDAGKDVDFSSPEVINLIQQIHPYTELAINVNHKNQPYLEELLEFCSRRMIFVNITVHKAYFIENIDEIVRWQNKGYIHGIGISYDGLYPNINDQLVECLNRTTNNVIHVVAGIIEPSQIQELANNEKLKDKLKILVLGYKNIGRGKTLREENDLAISLKTTSLMHFSEQWYREETFSRLSRQKSNSKIELIAFDGLALDQLEVKRWVYKSQFKELYSGDEGSYSFYLDLVDLRYARSSIESETYAIEDKTIVDMFNDIKGKPLSI